VTGIGEDEAVSTLMSIQKGCGAGAARSRIIFFDVAGSGRPSKRMNL
jgi:hypothetical protein